MDSISQIVRNVIPIGEAAGSVQWLTAAMTMFAEPGAEWLEGASSQGMMVTMWIGKQQVIKTILAANVPRLSRIMVLNATSRKLDPRSMTDVGVFAKVPVVYQAEVMTFRNSINWAAYTIKKEPAPFIVLALPAYVMLPAYLALIRAMSIRNTYIPIYPVVIGAPRHREGIQKCALIMQKIMADPETDFLAGLDEVADYRLHLRPTKRT